MGRVIHCRPKDLKVCTGDMVIDRLTCNDQDRIRGTRSQIGGNDR